MSLARWVNKLPLLTNAVVSANFLNAMLLLCSFLNSSFSLVFYLPLFIVKLIYAFRFVPAKVPQIPRRTKHIRFTIKE